MSFLLTIIFGLLLIIYPPKVHAIVVLPAVVLIPLVKLIALIVGALSVPIGSGGIIFAKITKKYKLVFLICVILVVLIGVIAAIVLRTTHPENPWF